MYRKLDPKPKTPWTRNTWIYVVVPAVALLGAAAWGFTKKACYPYTDSAGDSVCPGAQYKLQTISEMVARTPATTELFCAAAAMSIVGTRAALKDITADYSDGDHVIVETSFAVGAAGLIGLTVWSMRVSGDIHTGFTAQTLVMLLLISYMLSFQPKETRREIKALFVLEVVSLICYVGFYMTADHPAPDDPDVYFDLDIHKHAVAQIAFVVMYHLLLFRVHHTEMKMKMKE